MAASSRCLCYCAEVFSVSLMSCLSWQAWAGGDQEMERQELIQPVRFIEAGVLQLPKANQAFANRFGVAGSGNQGTLSFDLSDGERYDSEQAGRWRIQGQDLGLPNQSLTAELGQQGSYRFSYDHRSISQWGADGYVTPFLGAGGNVLTLPGNLLARTATGPSALPAMGAAFRDFSLETQRKRDQFSFIFVPTSGWLLKAQYRQETKDGSKLTGAASGSPGGSTLLLPEPIHTTTDFWSASLGYTGKTGFLSVGYEGSSFRNDVKSLSYQNPFSWGVLDNRMGTVPDNQAHKIRLDGAWRFSATHRVNGSFSWGRMTQDQAFLPYSTSPGAPSLPQASLAGVVVTQSGFLRWMARPSDKLNIAANYRYDDRDNRTPIANYAHTTYEVGVLPLTSLTNVPRSRRLSRLSLEADYLVVPGGTLQMGVESEGVRRHCGDLTTACTEVSRSVEESYRVEWQQALSPQTSGRMAYVYSERRGDGYTTLAEPSELSGMRKFFLADRDRTSLRSSVQSAVSDTVTLSGGIHFNEDHYSRSVYGLQDARNWQFNLNADFNVDEDLTFHAFLNRETVRSRMTNSYTSPGSAAVENPGAAWQATLHDLADTLGAGFRRNLLSGRLEINADLVLVQARTRYQINGGSCAANDTTLTGCTGLAASDLPDITTRSAQLRIGGLYNLERHSALRFQYQYARLYHNDYAYDEISAVSSSRVLGTNELSPRYSGHLFLLAYRYLFN